MKKHIVTILTIMILVSAPALAAVWTAQSSSGSGGSGSCYLVNFNTSSYGSKQFFGAGTVNGNTFSGLVSIYYLTTPMSRVYHDCSLPTSGDCVWQNIDSANNINTVSVSGLPITSAYAIACHQF